MVNPLIMPPILFGLVLAHLGAPAVEISRAVAIGFIFFFAIPLGLALRAVRAGRAVSIEMEERAGRTGPYLGGAASAAAATIPLAWFGTTAFALLAAVIACHALNALLFATINLRWKISLHSAAVAGFVSILLFVTGFAPAGVTDGAGSALLSPGGIVALLPLLLLVMWARVRRGAHTTGQTVAGALFGLTVPYSQLFLLEQAGLLVLP